MLGIIAAVVRAKVSRPDGLRDVIVSVPIYLDDIDALRQMAGEAEQPGGAP